MRDNVFPIILSIVCLVVVLMTLSYVKGYERGQIDAITGKINYRLIEDDN